MNNKKQFDINFKTNNYLMRFIDHLTNNIDKKNQCFVYKFLQLIFCHFLKLILLLCIYIHT
jgi:hypothetical protein